MVPFAGLPLVQLAWHAFLQPWPCFHTNKPQPDRMRTSLSLLAKKGHRSGNERIHTLIQQQEGSRSRHCSGSRCTWILPWTKVGSNRFEAIGA